MPFVRARLVAPLFAATLAAVLTGCATSIGSGGGGSTIALTSGQIGGKVHGGQQPVVGATVILWAAGTTGTGPSNYGANATQLATTVTSATGSFSFDNAISGASPCTPGQYLYLTATGGNPGAGTNTYSSMIAAIPTPCTSGLSGTAATQVWINEVTTVATVTALQQFMSINTSVSVPIPYIGAGTPPWQIGAPSTNLTGLANAFTQVGNLVNIATGVSAAFTVTSTQNSVTYTNTITPNSARIYTLANILASCINTSTASGVCSSLMADTQPNYLASTPSPAPLDTIQSMYYMATNPAGFTMNNHGFPTSPAWLCTTYPSAAAPFAPSQTCSAQAVSAGTSANYPIDWTIAVTWSNVNPSSALVGTTAIPTLAIDSLGDIWTANPGVGNAMVTVARFNQAGQLVLPPITGGTIVGGYQFSTYATTGTTYNLMGAHDTYYNMNLAIDTNNNAWYSGWYEPTYTVGTNTEGVITQITPSGTANGYLAGYTVTSLAVDANNDILFQGYEGIAKSYLGELVNTGTPSSPIYNSIFGGIASDIAYNPSMAVGEYVPSSTNPNAGDSTNGYVWEMPNNTNSGSSTAVATGACPGALWRATPDVNGLGSTGASGGAPFLNGINGNNVTPITGQSNVTLSNSSPTTCVNFGVIDQLGNMWGVYNNAYTVATGSYIEYINVINSITAPVISQFTTTTLGSGGSTITEPANNGTLANATAGGQAGGGLYDPIGIPAIDGAGNLWVANLDNTRYGGVSAFVPSINSTTGAATLTPLSPNGGICAWGFGNSGTGTAVTCNASGSAANVLPFEEPTGVDIDSSGNVWVPQTNGNVLGYIVGAAAPTVIPLAAQIANGTVGVKP